MSRDECISVKSDFFAFGTDIFFEIVTNPESEPIARKSLEKAEKQIREWEKIFSRFDAESELSRLNRSIGTWQKVSADMFVVAKICLSAYKQTEGLFDPRVIGALDAFGYDKDFFTNDFSVKGNEIELLERTKIPLSEELLLREGELCFRSRMDFSGAVKGYCVDRIREMFCAEGWDRCLVDAGGDMAVSGKDISGNTWRIGIEGFSEDKTFPIVEGAVATSGVNRRKWERSGRQYHHLIHPEHPDRFDFSLTQVTVMADSCLAADIRAKELFLLGSEKGREKSERENIPSLFLFSNGESYLSPAMKRVYDTSENL